MFLNGLKEIAFSTACQPKIFQISVGAPSGAMHSRLKTAPTGGCHFDRQGEIFYDYKDFSVAEAPSK
jgi:hypothetical protein